jgi:hypothetical protein
MRRGKRGGAPLVMRAACSVIVFLVCAAGCGTSSREGKEDEIMPTDDIKTVMESHVDGLMAIPGVVGVAIGALDDGRPCIRVLIVEDDHELRARIPRELDGHPVAINVTGEIRAMPGEGE